MTNTERASFGYKAVRWGDPDYQQNDFRTSTTDALTNIQHFCRDQSIDFDACLYLAIDHFLAEVSEETKGAPND